MTLREKFLIITWWLAFAAIYGSLQAQDQQKLSGRLLGLTPDGKNEPLPQARLWWEDAPDKGTLTDDEGGFQIAAPASWPARIVVSSVTHAADTFSVAEADGLRELTLKKLNELPTVNIETKALSTTISSLETIKTERLNQGEFRKAACCNLSESFETNASVDVSYSDPVTGLREIQMLGLSGRYVQTLIDNQPGLRGLGAAWGLTFIPGPWVNAVALNKGTGSVINGYESMTGQINIEMKGPENADALYLNLYANTNSRHEGNFAISRRLNDNWATALLLHGSRLPRRLDMNGDRFMDAPRSEQFSALNRWRFDAGDVEGQFGVSVTQDDREGGHMDFNARKPQSEQPVYGFDQKTRRVQAFSKTGYMFSTDGSHSLGFQTQWTLHEQQGRFGWKSYRGDERAVNLNLIYQRPWGKDEHQLRAGASYLYDEVLQTYNDSLMSRYESVPGVFTEYTFTPNKQWSWVAGLRADHHNLYGSWITPRLNGRFSPDEEWTFRAAAGRGRRVPNILLEQQNLLTTGRQLVFQQELQPEDAWNTGAGINRSFRFLNRAGLFMVDYYHTSFVNRTVADFDSNDTLVFIRNLDGRSLSNAVQVEVHYELMRRLQARFAYKYLDVRTTTGGSLRPETLQPVHRGFVNLAYSVGQWEFDATTHIFGPQRMPISQREDNWGFPRNSPSYAVLNAQVNYKHNHWTFFVGGENLTGVQQRNALRGADQSLTPAFDTSYVWGPLMRPLAYVGLHYSLPNWSDQKKKTSSDS